MVKQLNIRVSDLHAMMFEMIQEELKDRGFNMNKREVMEYVINETSKNLYMDKKGTKK